MLAFQVSINGQIAGTFGFEDWTVLCADLVALRSDAARLRSSDEIELNIGGTEGSVGADTYHHVRCFQRKLSRGEEVSLKIVDTDTVDPPIKRYRADATVQEYPFTEEEKLEFEREEYERLKAKFEPGS